METSEEEKLHSCEINLRDNPQRRKDKVYIGCGAGFGGDRPLAALKLLQRVPQLDYLVLECLAERTLADRYQFMLSGGPGYDPLISDWMVLLLPLAMERGTCIVTNMGAVDPLGAQKKVLDIAHSLKLSVTVAVVYEVAHLKSGVESSLNCNTVEGGVSTYLGAAPIVQCLEKHKPNVIITSRVADAALFLGPMVYELGWNWNDWNQLAQGSLAGHLLECGCQLTGGYFMHPGDKLRSMSFEHLLDLSLPFAEVDYEGKLCVAKAEGSGGVINFSTCAEQLLYEIGDPSAYITPDVVLDIRHVSFCSLSIDQVLCSGAKPSDQCIPVKLLQLVPKNCGWKAWGEISYGGHGCIERAKAAEFLVRSWMDEAYPGADNQIISYIIGLDSLKATDRNKGTSIDKHNEDIRLHMDGLFEVKEHAIHFIKDFTALYTNGPAGGGGIRTECKKEIVLEKNLVERGSVFWSTCANHTQIVDSSSQEIQKKYSEKVPVTCGPILSKNPDSGLLSASLEDGLGPAPSGQKIPLYHVAHSRAGDKGNDLNFSIIPHFLPDIDRLKVVITPDWVKEVVSPLLDASSFADLEAVDKRNDWVDKNLKVEIYEVKGIHSLNVVIRNILDGGVNCSRRIDRHGKSVSDLILCQEIVLPP